MNYDTNGGTWGNTVLTPDAGTSSNDKVTATVQYPEDLTRDGYTFAGWNTASSSSSDTSALPEYHLNHDTCENGGADCKRDIDITSDNVTLYAAWKPKEYTITFHSNGGKPATGAYEEQTEYTDTQEFKHGEPAALMADAPFKMEGYVLAGWNSSQEGAENGTVQYQAGQTVLNPVETDLYAVWKEGPTVRLAFNANGGSGAPSMKSYALNDSISVTVTLEFDSFNTPVREGYDFTGWATQSNAQAPDYTKDSATIELSTDTTLYAVWTKSKTYTISYSYNVSGESGSVPVDVRQYYIGDEINVAFNQTPSRSGYTFAGWSMKSDKAYNETDEDSSLDSMTDEEKAEIEMSYTYTEYGKNSFTLHNTMVTTENGTADGITLYAVWKPNTYSIIYKNSITNKEVRQSGINYGDVINLQSYEALSQNEAGEDTGFAANADLYEFKGWATTENGTVIYTEEDGQGASVSNLVRTNAGSITLYAVFE
ncbi:MAG: InlB B-repeat-containing protein [Lachnospiraceae bacterium]